MQARNNILEDENSKLRNERDTGAQQITKMSSKVNDMERDNSYAILQQQHEKLLDEL